MWHPSHFMSCITVNPRLSILAVLLAACAMRHRCEPIDGPFFSTEPAQVRVDRTNDPGLVQLHIAESGGRALATGALVSIIPDSGPPLSSNDTAGRFRLSRPFRLWVRSMSHRQADTLIVPRSDSGLSIHVQLPSVYMATPPLCIQR
jgi:hypothetical protein